MDSSKTIYSLRDTSAAREIEHAKAAAKEARAEARTAGEAAAELRGQLAAETNHGPLQ